MVAGECTHMRLIWYVLPGFLSSSPEAEVGEAKCLEIEAVGRKADFGLRGWNNDAKLAF